MLRGYHDWEFNATARLGNRGGLVAGGFGGEDAGEF